MKSRTCPECRKAFFPTKRATKARVAVACPSKKYCGKSCRNRAGMRRYWARQFAVNPN